MQPTAHFPLDRCCLHSEAPPSLTSVIHTPDNIVFTRQAVEWIWQYKRNVQRGLPNNSGYNDSYIQRWYHETQETFCFRVLCCCACELTTVTVISDGWLSGGSWRTGSESWIQVVSWQNNVAQEGLIQRYTGTERDATLRSKGGKKLWKFSPAIAEN